MTLGSGLDIKPATPPGGSPRRRPNGHPTARGDLFRALVDAGAEAMVAYTAERGTEAMVLDIVVAQIQPVLVEVQRLRSDTNARFDAMDSRMDKLAEDGAKRDRQLEALMAQMRLLLAGFGVLVTVLIVGFGFLLAN